MSGIVWRKGHRFDGDTPVMVEEGLIDRQEYEHMTFRLHSLERETTTLRRHLADLRRLAAEALDFYWPEDGHDVGYEEPYWGAKADALRAATRETLKQNQKEEE